MIGENKTNNKNKILNVNVDEGFLLTINGNLPVDDQWKKKNNKTEVLMMGYLFLSKILVIKLKTVELSFVCVKDAAFL